MDEKFDFLRKNKSETVGDEVNWQEEREKWIVTLEMFYKELERWLKEPIDEGLISIQFIKHSITEEYLGTYEAPGFKIFTKGKYLEFVPVGRLIIGAQGRIDLFTEKGDLMLLKLDADNNWIAKEKKRNGMQGEWNETYFIQIVKWAVS